MIKIERVKVAGIEPAVRGMRNPLNSWDRSDSNFTPDESCGNNSCGDCLDISNCNYLGDNDYDLMRRLANGGSDDRKFMRMIIVYMDITAPLYW